ncbi:MAG TPA: hypothetical protein PKH33_12045 [bacterium]|nr:hypothetical protein [bacterium]
MLKSALKIILCIFAAFLVNIIIEYAIIEGALPTFVMPISNLGINIFLLLISAVVLISSGELISKASNRNILCCLLFAMVLFTFHQNTLHGSHLYLSRVIINYVFPAPDFSNISFSGENNIDSDFITTNHLLTFYFAWFANFAFIFGFTYLGTKMSKYFKRKYFQIVFRYLIMVFWLFVLLLTLAIYFFIFSNTGSMPFQAFLFHFIFIIAIIRLTMAAINLSFQIKPFRISRNQPT